MEKTNEKNSLEIEKIVVSEDDELIDVLKEIAESNAKKVILTFTEPTDILISPINLRVILEQADELSKPLIALVIQNPVGIRNAKEIGMTVTETSGSILDSFWEEAETSMNSRIREREESLKKRKLQKPEEVTETEGSYKPEDEAATAQVVVQQSEFQKNIEEALSKSSKNADVKNKVINENGLIIGIDQEINEGNKIEGNVEKGPSMIGKNIRNLKNPSAESDSPIGVVAEKRKFVMPKVDMSKFKLPKIKTGILLKILLPLAFLVITSLALAYFFLPFVKVNIFVQSKQVAINKVFTGDPTTTEYDIEKGKVPVKKETIGKSAGDTIKATGTGYKGTKAEGILKFTYWDIQVTKTPLSLPAGTKVTSGSGLVFTTNANAVIGEVSGGIVSNIFKEIPVTASNVGEDYNLAAGQLFTVGTYSQAKLYAQNEDAIAGGTKTPYKILSVADVTKSSDALKKTLFDQSVGDLDALNVDGWQIIDTTISKNLDGDVATDIPVGAEADTVNITVKTKVSALFYQKGDIENSINKLLTDSANNGGLFSDNSSSLIFSQDAQHDISITSVKKDVVTLTVTASSWIRPEIDKDALAKEIKGKGWKKGIELLTNKSYMAKTPTLEFQPTYFPEWLRYFPTQQGKIYISIQEVDSSVK